MFAISSCANILYAKGNTDHFRIIYSVRFENFVFIHIHTREDVNNDDRSFFVKKEENRQ
jgi:hypothetical protein